MKKKSFNTRSENIKDYEKYRPVAFLSKKNSYNSIIIAEDIFDPEFLNVLTYRKKSGEIVENSTIVDTDLQSYISLLTSSGWTLEK